MNKNFKALLKIVVLAFLLAPLTLIFARWLVLLNEIIMF